MSEGHDAHVDVSGVSVVDCCSRIRTELGHLDDSLGGHDNSDEEVPPLEVRNGMIDFQVKKMREGRVSEGIIPVRDFDFGAILDSYKKPSGTSDVTNRASESRPTMWQQLSHERYVKKGFSEQEATSCSTQAGGTLAEDGNQAHVCQSEDTAQNVETEQHQADPVPRRDESVIQFELVTQRLLTATNIHLSVVGEASFRIAYKT